MNYTTQMDAARKGILTKELMAVAGQEQWEPEKLRELVAEGKVAVPANKNHTCFKAKRDRIHAEDKDQREPWDLQGFE